MKCDATLKFDIKNKTQSDIIYCAYFKHNPEFSGIFTEPGTKISFDKAHRMLWYCDKSRSCNISKEIDWGIKL